MHAAGLGVTLRYVTLDPAHAKSPEQQQSHDQTGSGLTGIKRGPTKVSNAQSTPALRHSHPDPLLPRTCTHTSPLLPRTPSRSGQPATVVAKAVGGARTQDTEEVGIVESLQCGPVVGEEARAEWLNRCSGPRGSGGSTSADAAGRVFFCGVCRFCPFAPSLLRVSGGGWG